MPTYFLLPVETHNRLVSAAYQARGFDPQESDSAAYWCGKASWYGIRTHNAIKALHLDTLLGSGVGGCTPQAEIEPIPTPFPASEKWDCHHKLGQPVAEAAMRRCMELADQYGIGSVSVDNAFHYLWGGGYVMDAALKGYFAYTTCTAGLAEVVPFGGVYPTIGTNPHSWGIPTAEAVGFPVVIDWATSAIAMGKVQSLARENKPVPPGCALDKQGQPTQDPHQVACLLPFGSHKGYGLGLMTELVGAMIGGSLPTLRGRFGEGGSEKRSMSFFFQCIHPEAMGAGAFSTRGDQAQNLKAVIGDILGHGNDRAILPGQIEHEGGQLSQRFGGLLFSDNEIHALAEELKHSGVVFDPAGLEQVSID
ncbi:MAG: Ldh family oxidoreductase [Verrucomicrobiota bacterium]|jgi:ureidoglycolate dehydrogenase (NAD+)